VINIHCKNCGQKINVPDTYSGKKGKCPKCKSIVVIPSIITIDFLEDQNSSIGSKQNDLSLPISDIHLEKRPPTQTDKIFTDDFNVAQYDERFMKVDQPEEPPARKLPWFLDIFLYPTSTSGLINMGIFWLLPILIGLIAWLLPIPFVWAIVGFIVGTYMYYYLIECIRDSATGGIRAPDNTNSIPLIGEAFSQAMEILASVIIFWGPVGFYYLFTQKVDVIFLLLMGYGIFFFPMGLLAFTMFRSSAAYNPFLWIISIISTFFQYCGLVLLFCVLAWLIFLIFSYLRVAMFLSYFSGAVFIYLAMIGAHLLGRFYYLNSQKLNWEV
jgi:hypothetical protein